MKVKIQLAPGVQMPTYATDGSAGFDLAVNEEIVIHPGQTRVVGTGIRMAVPEDWELQIRPRSGTSLKTKIRISNSPGTIDSDYRGEIGIIIDHIGDTIFTIPKGMKIAQGVLCPVGKASFEEVRQLDNTLRGEGGFGSTDGKTKT